MNAVLAHAGRGPNELDQMRGLSSFVSSTAMRRGPDHISSTAPLRPFRTSWMAALSLSHTIVLVGPIIWPASSSWKILYSGIPDIYIAREETVYVF
jgi:hypothetical protein